MAFQAILSGLNGDRSLRAKLRDIFTLQGLADYTMFGFDEDAFLADNDGIEEGIDGGTTNVLSIMANLKAQMPLQNSRILPYAIGGVGYISQTFEDIKVNGNTIMSQDTENSLGLGIGAGVDFSIASDMFLFAEGKYMVGFNAGDDLQYVPIRLGIRF